MSSTVTHILPANRIILQDFVNPKGRPFPSNCAKMPALSSDWDNEAQEIDTGRFNLIDVDRSTSSANSRHLVRTLVKPLKVIGSNVIQTDKLGSSCLVFNSQVYVREITPIYLMDFFVVYTETNLVLIMQCQFMEAVSSSRKSASDCRIPGGCGTAYAETAGEAISAISLSFLSFFLLPDKFLFRREVISAISRAYTHD